jgi:hypothetical protein
MKAIGTEIGFSFTLYGGAQRSGRGIVVANDDYTVWPCPGYAVRVTESPEYPAGEIVKVSTVSARP